MLLERVDPDAAYDRDGAPNGASPAPKFLVSLSAEIASQAWRARRLDGREQCPLSTPESGSEHSSAELRGEL